MAYQRPMVTVDQNMTTTPTSVEREQPAFIFGPNYELHRYSDAVEKPKTFLGTYSGQDIVEPYPGAVDGSKVDTSSGYTKLIGDDVVVNLCELSGGTFPEIGVPSGYLSAKGGYTKILFGNKAYVDYDVDGSPVERETGLKRNLVAGDYVRITYGKEGNSGESTSFVTKIVSVEFSSEGFNLDSDSSSEGGPGTLITLYDSIPEGSILVSVNLVAVLNGVEFEKENHGPSGTPWAWQEEYVTEGSSGSYCVKVFGECLFTEYYEYYGDYTPAYVFSANLYVTYRELVTSFSDSFYSLVGASEVEAVLGTIDPANPLAMGVYMAALNAANDDGDEAPPVYFMAVPSDDEEGYASVLNKATLTDRAYVFAPTTQDDNVLELVRNHVLEMSAKTVKKWRIAVGSSEVPSTRTVLGKTASGLSYFAVPMTDAGTMTAQEIPYNKFKIVKSKTDASDNTDVDLRSTNLLVEGDDIWFYPTTDKWGKTHLEKFKVKKVLSRNTVEVYPNIAASILPQQEEFIPQQIEAYHEYSAAERADKVASVSRAFASRRMVNVFPDWFDRGGEKIEGMFGACAVAGLISSTEPQQPITNMTIRGIDNVPAVYDNYNSSQLDTMAAGGTFIIAQDMPDDIVYVRHQITTAYPDGNINTGELSITKNVDSISYAFAEVFRPYNGKYNITPELVAIIENLAGQLISRFGGSTSVYGPQLVAERTSIKYVRENPLLKDHVDVAISVGVPYPCNNIDIVLTV